MQVSSGAYAERRRGVLCENQFAYRVLPQLSDVVSRWARCTEAFQGRAQMKCKLIARRFSIENSLWCATHERSETICLREALDEGVGLARLFAESIGDAELRSCGVCDKCKRAKAARNFVARMDSSEQRK